MGPDGLVELLDKAAVPLDTYASLLKALDGAGPQDGALSAQVRATARPRHSAARTRRSARLRGHPIAPACRPRGREAIPGALPWVGGARQHSLPARVQAARQACRHSQLACEADPGVASPIQGRPQRDPARPPPAAPAQDEPSLEAARRACVAWMVATLAPGDARRLPMSQVVTAAGSK